MALSDRALRAFTSTVRSRGQDYFERDLVEIEDGSETRIRAIVHGTDEYDVEIRLVRNVLLARCDCPYFYDHDVCKHVWATLLAANRSPHLGAAKRDTTPLRVSGLDDEYDDEPDEDENVARMLVASHRGSGGAISSPAPASRAREAPAWQRVLDGERPSAAQPARRTEPAPDIVYLVDGQLSEATGQLTVGVAERRVLSKKQGSETALFPCSMARQAIEHLPDADDRAILGVLAGAISPASAHQAYFYGGLGTSQLTLPPALRDLLLPMMCRTGRCHLRRGPREAEPTALRWDDGPPWQLEVRVADVPSPRADRDAGWQLGGAIVRGEESIPVDRIDRVLDEGAVLTGDTVRRIEGERVKSWIAGLRHGVAIAPSERQAFFEKIHNLPDLPRIALPEGWNVPEVRVAPTPRLVLHAPAPDAPMGAPIYATLSFDYDRFEVAARSTKRVMFDTARWRLLPRAPAPEAAARERLGALSFREAEPSWQLRPPEDADLQIAPKHVPKAARTLVSEGWRVEASGKLYRSPGTFEMGITSGIDWFELSARVDFEGISADLAAVLAALRRGESTLVLDDGSVGILPEEWLSRYGLFVDMATIEGGKLRYRKSQIGVLDALVAAQPEIAVDAVFAAAREDLSRAASITAAEAPPSFQGTLRPYQKDGLGWLLFLDRFGFGGCLADDMGLGKTVQVLALLAEKKARAAGPALVVAPRSLIFNWKAEAARFTPELRVLDHTGGDRLPPGEHFRDHDLVLTTYGTLRRDADALAAFPFAYAILDEAQAIKNERSDTARAARRLRADHRLALSGTPIENHLGELWSLFEFLNPGILGRASLFKGVTGSRVELPAETLALLARALKPFILRRTKAAVAKDLPDKLEETWMCELDGKQRDLYDELRNHYRASLKARVEKGGLAKAKIHILEALLRLRQVACHAGLVDRKRLGDPSAKLDALFAELPALRESGQKALVFSQFTSLLSIVRQRLDEEKVPYEYLDGRTVDRDRRVQRFQTDPGCGLFLVSLKAGGLGLNLTAAEYVFLLDPWWNPAAEAQAIDRAHRIGQTKPVFAYRLIAKDTIEERIAELQRTKRHLAESVIEADGSLMKEMTAEDLDLLLS